MTAKWLVPALGYVFVVGALGVTGKLALRTLSWQDVLLWTTIGYVVVAAALLALGQTRIAAPPNTEWAIASGALAIGGLVLLYTALGRGEAVRVIPVTAAYPVATLAIAAVALGERVSPARLGGVALVAAGVVVISRAA